MSGKRVTISDVSKQLDQIVQRLEMLEAESQHNYKAGNTDVVSRHSSQICNMPKVVERSFLPSVSNDRQKILRYIDKKWVSGTELRYYFFTDDRFGGRTREVDMVRDGFKIWEDVGIGIQFTEVSAIQESDIRIGFLSGDGAWSYLGRDIENIGNQERTMNFGWDITRDSRKVDVAVHEIGHTLGFPHEHQNPNAGIVWDKDAVMQEFSGPPNYWNEASIRRNILNKLSSKLVEGTDFDQNSIMCYGFGSGLILQPEALLGGFEPELGLSAMDILEVRKFYPEINDRRNPILDCYQSELLSMESAEQKNFTIKPKDTREYTIQTFGKSDTVMVLFEADGDDFITLAADDDSGLEKNSQIKVWLDKDKTYVLRLRLYLNYASGDSAVMIW